MFVILWARNSFVVASMLTDLQVRNFFYEYASRMNNALLGDRVDIDGIVKSFAEHFVGADPHGVAVGENSDPFKTVITKGISFYQRLGIRSMVILEQRIDLLDEFHTLAKVHWKCIFERVDKSGEIIFVNFYMVQSLAGGAPKIFAYVTGDEMKAFNDYGLL